jgi:transcriptional regulator with XRE-family HTH domain
MGWSQVRLADHLGVQGETISRIERGLQMPSMHKLADICLTLRLPLSRLVAEAEGTGGKMSSRDASGPLREILADLSADEREFVLEVASRCAKLLRARRAV